MTKGIPKVRAWRVTLENGERYLVWAPNKVLARLNFRAVPECCGLEITQLTRWKSADDRPVPLDLIERI